MLACALFKGLIELRPEPQALLVSLNLSGCGGRTQAWTVHELSIPASAVETLQAADTERRGKNRVLGDFYDLPDIDPFPGFRRKDAVVISMAHELRVSPTGKYEAAKHYIRRCDGIVN